MNIIEMEKYARTLGQIIEKFLSQDSGNICYSIQTKEKRIWIKFLDLEKSEIENLQKVIDFYNSCTSPLISKNWELLQVNDKYLMKCDWLPGKVLNSPNENRNDDRSVYRRFMNLPFSNKLDVYGKILQFFYWLESENIIIEDFYDGCILYDFEGNNTYLCDLDHLHRGPYQLAKERQYGSSRFMAPEEFQKGSVINFTTNVYTMGATGFVLMNDNNRERNAWKQNPKIYDFLHKAVSEDQAKRFHSIKEMYCIWKEIL